MVNFEYFLDKFLVPLIYILIVIKIIFLFSILAKVYIVKILKDDKIIKKYYKKLEKIKERTEFIFIFLTSIMMIAIFYPRQNNLKYIDSHVKLLFYLFGWVLIITAKWNLFFHESPLFKNISNSLE